MTNNNLNSARRTRSQVAQLDGMFYFPRLIIGALLVSVLGSPIALMANIFLIAVIPSFIILTLTMRYVVTRRTKVVIRSPHYYTSSIANFIGNGADVCAQTISAVISLYYGFDTALLNVFAVLTLFLCFYRIPFYIVIFMNKPELAFKWINFYITFVTTINKISHKNK